MLSKSRKKYSEFYYLVYPSDYRIKNSPMDNYASTTSVDEYWLGNVGNNE